MLKKTLKLILISIPFFVGVLGYLNIPNITLSSAFYHAIRLYSLNTDTDDINLFIEVARWTAPFVTMSVVLFFAKSVWLKIVYNLRATKKNSCSVYGDGIEAAFFIESLGTHGIKGNLKKPLVSKYHVFFTKSMNEVIDILNNHSIKKLMEEKRFQFYFNVPSDVNIAFKRNDIHTFSIEENTGIIYWSSHMAKPGEKIAIIGSNNLCDAILDKGLQSNIFEDYQQIEYHIWSNTNYHTTRASLNDALSMTFDKVIVYDKSWENSLHDLNKMDRIIVAYDSEDNHSIGIKLMNIFPQKKIHIKSDFDYALKDLFVNQHISYFGKLDDIINYDIIIKESLRNNAKEIHEHWQKFSKEKQSWDELPSFLIKSNISAAAFYPVIQKIASEELSKDNAIPIELLCKLEHIRWCRFHYLQNWKYGPVKCAEKQTHPLLIPYKDLPVTEKNKDKSNVELALENAGINK